MRILPTLVAAALLAVSTSALAASPVEGLWRTPTKGGQVEIYPCGDALCGKLVTSDGLKLDPDHKDELNKDPALRSRPLKGLVMLTGFTGGPSAWKGGKVYDPSSGSTYGGSMKLVNAKTLELTGCIVWPACRSQTWIRLK